MLRSLFELIVADLRAYLFPTAISLDVDEDTTLTEPEQFLYSRIERNHTLCTKLCRRAVKESLHPTMCFRRYGDPSKWEGEWQ